MLEFLNYEKNSSLFLEFNKVADIKIGGFKNLDEQNLEFKNSKILVKRNINLLSDVFYFSRENLYKTQETSVFSFFDNSTSSSNLYVPDGNCNNEKTIMRLNVVNLISFKNNFFTYDLTQKISLANSHREVVYKVKNIRLITNLDLAYLIYPNGMGRIYKK